PTVKQFIKTSECLISRLHKTLVNCHDEMHLEDIYVDITLVEGQVETKSGRKSNKGLDKACKIYNIDEGEHAAISTDNLFDFSEREQRETKVIALLGRAGIGKSVLVQRVCLDWVNGSFGQFEFVFWFKCRTLNLEKQYKLRDLLFEPFLPALRDTGEVFQYLCHHPDKVLVIVDDFEDFQDCDGLLQPTTCPSREKPQSVRQLLAGLLQKKLLRGCTVLVTARPRGTFNQYLTRVDKVVEVMGFSPQHREEFVRKYFEDSSLAVKVSECLQQHRFMLSFCFIPLFCRFLCFILKAKHRAGDKCLTLPATLTSLFQSIFQVLLQSGAYTRSGTQTPALLAKHKANLLRLSTLAYSGVQSHSSVCAESETAAMTNFALKHGFLRPFLMNGQEREQECGKAFSHSALQNFLGAMYLLFSEDVKCKGLLRIIMLEQKKKRSQEDWLDIVRRALVGLAFQEGSDFIDCFVNNPKNKVKSKKQKSLQRYLGELDTSALSGVRLLELCHCVHETQNPELATRVASKLNETLSFLRTRLTPPDIFVLLHLMQKSPRKFCIDLRETGIDLPGIRQFVELKNVTSFRVSVTDAVKLWEHLEQTGEEELLHTSLLKFSVNPFEVNSLKDIDDLDLLVQLHKGRRFLSWLVSLFSCSFSLSLSLSLPPFLSLALLPCLSRLELMLRSFFLTLFHSLYDNIIGDKGAEKLAEILPAMTSLKVLDVQFNNITDVGAQSLTHSLKNCPHMESIWLVTHIVTARMGGFSGMAREVEYLIGETLRPNIAVKSLESPHPAIYRKY
uniref:NACHT domain-containing protein n=1 Tax=Callorhinchus milii TaxID=7868 RepID=A0A4W3HS43_CALMI